MAGVDSVQLVFQADRVWIMNAVIGLIMFGVAIDLKTSDFRVLLDQPRAAIIGILGQFVLLPAVSFLLVLALRPEPSIALGVILIASCPGGNLSNFITYLARGNAPLSIGMTILSTVAALVMTPLNLGFWGGLHPGASQLLREVRLDPWDVASTVFLILGLPLACGLVFARRFPRAADRLHKPFKWGSIAFFLLFVAIVFAQNYDVFTAHAHWVAGAVALQNLLGYAAGYTAARAARLPERDARAIAIEVGMQNSALGLALVFQFFGGLGGMALVAGFWGIWHIISGFTLAYVWSRRPVPAPCAETA